MTVLCQKGAVLVSAYHSEPVIISVSTMLSGVLGPGADDKSLLLKIVMLAAVGIMPSTQLLESDQLNFWALIASAPVQMLPVPGPPLMDNWIVLPFWTMEAPL